MTTDPRLPFLAELEKKILWLASWTIHNANHIRQNEDGMKVGGHQASSASLATIMTALYMAALSAMRYEPRLRDFYQGLRARGKPAKVAIVAVMRKLLVILNARMRDAMKEDAIVA